MLRLAVVLLPELLRPVAIGSRPWGVAAPSSCRRCRAPGWPAAGAGRGCTVLRLAVVLWPELELLRLVAIGRRPWGGRAFELLALQGAGLAGGRAVVRLHRAALGSGAAARAAAPGVDAAAPGRRLQ